MTHPTVGEDEFPAVCPHLGLADDADSHATYATEAHRCYRLPTPTRIATGHQETYCLGENHVQCPVYRGEGIPGPAAAGPAAPARTTRTASPPPPAPEAGGSRPMPGRPRPPAAEGERRRPAPGAVGPRPRAGGISMPVATVGLFVGAVVVIALAFLVQQALSDDDDGGPSPADAVATNAALKTKTPASQPTAAGTQTPQPGTPTRPAGTTTPGTPTTPGAAKTYTVKSGDFCGSIAEAQGVTLAALLAANNLTEDDCTKLQVGQVLKIP